MAKDWEMKNNGKSHVEEQESFNFIGKKINGPIHEKNELIVISRKNKKGYPILNTAF